MSYEQEVSVFGRGVIDGNQCNVLQLSDALKHYEIIKQVMDPQAGFVTGGASIMINLKIWKEMPKDVQEIFNKLNYDLGAYWAKELYQEEAAIWERWAKRGVIMGTLTGENARISQEAATKAQKDFIKKLESQGQANAAKVWEYFRGQAIKYEKEIKEKGHPWERK